MMEDGEDITSPLELETKCVLDHKGLTAPHIVIFLKFCKLSLPHFVYKALAKVLLVFHTDYSSIITIE